MKSSKLNIALIDYGMGNLRSVENALKVLNQGTQRVSNGKDLAAGDWSGIILPGVGAFGPAIRNLCERGFEKPLRESVEKRRIPIFGICLGMQLFAERSFEGGEFEGLGWVPAEVRALDSHGGRLAVPHVGWNTLSWMGSDLFANRVDPEDHFYFDHSFALISKDASVIACTDYGSPVVAAVRRGHVFGVQFHPEKSHRPGLKLIRNFLNFCISDSEARYA